MIFSKYVMTHFKDIFAGIRSCFSLSSGARLIILLALSIFLVALFLRWRLLADERPGPRAPTSPAGQERR